MNKTSITKCIADALPIALLAVYLSVGPSTTFARERGGAAFAERQPSFAPAARERSGAASAGRQLSFAPAARERSGAASAEREPSSAPAEREPSSAPAARAPAPVHERTATVPNDVKHRAALATIESRLATLDARLAAGTVATQDIRLHRDRIARTGEFLTGLVDLGTPDWEIDAWTDALCQDEIIAGMPSDLVVDYWGNPIATDNIFLAGAPAEVWTYRLQPGRTDRITVAHGAVTSVRHF